MIKMATKRGQMSLWSIALFFSFFNRLLISSSFCALENCTRNMLQRHAKKKSQLIFGAFPSFEVLDGDFGVDTALAVG